MAWSSEKINNKLKYLRKQKENTTGKYREYLVNTYMYIKKDCEKFGYSNARSRDMREFVMGKNYDHDWYSMIEKYKNELKEMGYIKYLKKENRWETHIIKELDF